MGNQLVIIELESLHKLLGQEVAMVGEATLEEIFSDCELAAVPPIGMAYGGKDNMGPEIQPWQTG